MRVSSFCLFYSWIQVTFKFEKKGNEIMGPFTRVYTKRTFVQSLLIETNLGCLYAFEAVYTKSVPADNRTINTRSYSGIVYTKCNETMGPFIRS